MSIPINYVEFPAKNIESTKRFFIEAFGWTFTDYGPEYTAFNQSGLNGGFYQSSHCSTTQAGAALIVLYSEKLEETLSQIKTLGGKIVKDIFPFPGGRRFHFIEPSGNELAVWSDK